MQLSAFMESKGLDDRDVAEAIKVDRSTVSRLRRGQTYPCRKTARAIREFTGGAVTSDDFDEAV